MNELGRPSHRPSAAAAVTADPSSRKSRLPIGALSRKRRLPGAASSKKNRTACDSSSRSRQSGCAAPSRKRQAICAALIAILSLGLLFAPPAVKTSTAASASKWTNLQNKYRYDKNVKHLVFVKYNGRTKTKLYLYKKTKKNTWKKVLSCKAYVGQNGIDKVREGDRRTPTGEFLLETPFGIKKNPGSKMGYTKVNKYLYWCGDRSHYNRMIDIRKHRHKCRGEHLINYTKQYAYCMNIGYNKAGVYGKGSAIFLHCFGYNNYTLGCVAVSKTNMKKIIRTCTPGTRICIYRK